MSLSFCTHQNEGTMLIYTFKDNRYDCMVLQAQKYLCHWGNSRKNTFCISVFDTVINKWLYPWRTFRKYTGKNMHVNFFKLFLFNLFFVSCPKLYFDNMALVLLVADYHPFSTSNERLQYCRNLITASHKRFSRAGWELCSIWSAKFILLNFISEEEGRRQFMEKFYNHQTIRT